ncbi:MAG: VCBS repeat-containing protein, partial [Myxococcota bacterium]
VSSDGGDSDSDGGATPTDGGGDIPDPGPAECENGTAEPGEVCFGDTTLLNGGDAVYVGRFAFANNDANLDVVYTISDQFQTHFGAGDGTFDTEPTVGATVFHNYLAVADFNNDGIDDYAGGNTDMLDTHRGNGSGGHTAASTNVDLTEDLSDLVIAQLDSGPPDVIAGVQGLRLLTVSMDGRVTLSHSVGGSASRVATADFDGDGNTDIAAGITGMGVRGVRIYRGEGNGDVQPPLNTPVTAVDIADIATGDINGDGDMDIAYVIAATNTLGIMLGNGGAAFAEPITFTTGAEPFRVEVVEVSNDNTADVVVAHRGDQRLDIFPGQSEGGVGAPVPVLMPAPITDLSAGGDANGDSVPDLVATSVNSELVIVVLSTP